MLLILFTTLVLLYIFMSAGNALYLLLRYEARNPFLPVFIGMFVIGILGMTASIFVSLNTTISLLCFLPAVLGAIPTAQKLKKYCTASPKACICTFMGLCVLAGLYAFTAAWSEWPAIAYDTDLYHAQIIRWLNEYGTPFGLGNLHSRLANSSFWLILAALLNHGFLQGSVAWYMMPLFMTALTGYFLFEIYKSTHIWVRVYAMCILPVCVYANTLWGYPNLYHDFPSLAVVLILGCELLYFLYSTAENIEKNAAIVALCAALAFLIKPLPIVSVFFTVMFIFYILHTHRRLNFYSIVLIFALPLCAALVWCAKSILTSGYPIFPLAIFPLDVDWRMAQWAIKGNAVDVRAWARMPGPQYMKAYNNGITYWFIPWAHNLILTKINWLSILTPLCGGTAILLYMRNTISTFKDKALLAWPLLSIAYWFWLAPDIRFGTEYFWLFFALSASVLARYQETRLLKYQALLTKTKFTHVLFVMCFALLLLSGGIAHHYKHTHRDIAWLKPGSIVPRPTEIHIISPQQGSPFPMHVPIQGEGDRCGDAPLPCTPYLNPHLMMRKDGHLGAGFRIPR